MDVRAMESFTSLLAIIAASGAVVLVFARAISSSWIPAADFVRSVHSVSTWLAWLVAAVAAAGSLYFSEVADYVPCRLCWFQRICMYPLAGILLVAALRRDRAVRWYALPLLVAGAVLSSYHYLIEWRPSLDGGACGVGPSCTDVWFRSFGFVTLAFMALSGFAAVAALLFVTPVAVRGDREED
jgi:disulfide bond formation protein DsbB